MSLIFYFGVIFPDRILASTMNTSMAEKTPGFPETASGVRQRVTEPSSGSDQTKTGEIKTGHVKETIAAGSQIVLGQWLVMVGLIFGGCCSNVFTLESIIKEQPGAGPAITLCQFLFVSIEGFIYHFDSSGSFFLKSPKIPFANWLLPVAIFYAVSMLNNYALAFDIPIPFHIVFRSGGTVTTMALGFLLGKRYSILQVTGVIILSAGVILSTFGQQQQQQQISHTDRHSSTNMFGVMILLVATILGSLQGVVGEKIYAKYGRHWRESLFYTHFLSLFLFIPLVPSISTQIFALARHPPFLTVGSIQVSKQILMLLLNAVTQYLCVRGVNNLAGHMSALTVTIVLNLRKFTSLLLSVYIFGNKMSSSTVSGTIMVFSGALLYSIASAAPRKVKTA